MLARKLDDVGRRRTARCTWIRWLRAVAVHPLRGVVAIAALGPASAALAQQTPVVTGDSVERTQAIDVYVSERALQAQYSRNLELGHVGTTRIRAGFFYNEERDLIGVGDLLAYSGKARDPRNRRLEFRVGTRIYAAFLAMEDNDVFSVAVGGEAEWFFTKNRGASLLLDAFYAPDILTFGEADDISDAALRLQLPLTDQTNVFVGYRLFSFDQDTGERDVDDSVHIGFQFRF